MTGSTSSAADTAQDSRVFGTLGGRAIAILAVALIFSYNMVTDRSDARRKLQTYSREAHAAAYKEALDKLKETADETDGGIVGLGVVLCSFLLIYEGAAVGFGWLLIRLTESPRTATSRVDGP